MAWGYQLCIDLKECNAEKIRSEEEIKKFVKELLSVIEMTPYGETILVRFGSQEDVYGYSMIQLIEESHICAHFIENINAVALDIFSCKKFDIAEATRFIVNYFEAKDNDAQYLERID